MNLHNSENSIRDLTDILSSFVWSQQSCEVYFISFAVAKPLWSLTFKYYGDRPPPKLNLTRWVCPWFEVTQAVHVMAEVHILNTGKRNYSRWQWHSISNTNDYEVTIV